jgi:hypothetical protein
MIYFAGNGRKDSSVRGSWTAISRAPYLKAVSLFAKGDCWHGGGLFQSSSEYWLNDGYGHEVHAEDPRLRRVATYPWHVYYGGECEGVYYIRLQRDGWKLQSTSARVQEDRVSVFEKRINDRWILRKRAHATTNHPVGRGVYYDTHELFNERTEEVLAKENWEWAEVDGKRLVWAADGCLYKGRVGTKGLYAEEVVHDFRSMQFVSLPAPY